MNVAMNVAVNVLPGTGHRTGQAVSSSARVIRTGFRCASARSPGTFEECWPTVGPAGATRPGEEAS